MGSPRTEPLTPHRARDLGNQGPRVDSYAERNQRRVPIQPTPKTLSVCQARHSAAKPGVHNVLIPVMSHGCQPKTGG